MASGWSVMDALNQKSKEVLQEKPKARFRTKDISVMKMYGSSQNFYSMTDIEKLAQDILAVGLLENMTVMYAPCETGEYKILAGERRWRALQLLVEKGYSEFEVATCQIKSAADEAEEKVMLIMANGYRNKTVMDILEEEKQLKEALQTMKDNGTQLQGYSLDSGRLRDVIAQIMNTSCTKVAQIESINKRLIPEFTQELKEGRLTFSAAYEISILSEEKQQEMLNRYKEGGLTYKDIKEEKERLAEEERKKQLEGQMKYPDDFEESIEEDDTEEQEETEEEADDEEEWQQAHPESITSLCYSCQRYADCNVKTGTCQNCDRYVNKAEAEKTEEQRYNEEQDRIDRETKKRLQEMEQEEKMNNLPSDKKRFIRMSIQTAERIRNGLQTYLIIKEKDIKEGMDLYAYIFSEGRNTGEQMKLHVIQADDDSTSSAIEEGYTVIGFTYEDQMLKEGLKEGMQVASYGA